MWKIGAGVILLAGSGCIDLNAKPSALERVNVWHDDKRGVTCWVVTDALERGVAVSCLPDSALNAQEAVR